MKKGMKILAASLTAAMMMTSVPASAAPRSGSYTSNFSFSNWWERVWDKGSDNEEAPDEGTNLELLEDESTVENGEMLRASTYALTDSGSTRAAARELKYFPVTFCNYDERTINQTTHAADIKENASLQTWQGIYFNNGYPGQGSYSYAPDDGSVNYTSVDVSYNSAGDYKSYTNGDYYYKYGDHFYPITSLRCKRETIWFVNTYTWTIGYNGTTATEKGNPLTVYKASQSVTVSADYANWNYWAGYLTVNNTVSQGLTDMKSYVYTGLVESKLNNGQIKFTVPDGGIFNSRDTSNKEVYTNVGLPFVYSEDGYYTFDASQDAVYFSGTPASGVNLQWNDNPQYNQYQNQNGFYPFNEGTTVTNPDYHFGMIAAIPFSMTSDGKVSSASDEDIQFDFAGDDDVWVFVDGTLVLDMGGIHSSVNGSINFGKNTTTISATEAGEKSGAMIKGGASVSGIITGKLFNDENGQGLLNTDIATFSATDQHTLTVYYLERGKGSSNCKIKFNLPVKDMITVRKSVSSQDSAGADLDSETLQQIENRDFNFTLYKDETPLRNATYNLYNADNQYVSTASTDNNGRFTLKNGQTAKFVDEIEHTGSAYYVVEESEGEGWEVPGWSYTAQAADGATVTESDVDGKSMTVTANGSIEAEDHVAFVCENTMTHVDGTSLEANDDKIVIDYGLPVVIDVLKNDVAVNGVKSIESITDGKYGQAVIEDGKIKYQLTKPLTKVEVLTYTVKATADTEADNKTKTANVYIIPATSMYYEENFSDMVTFDGAWTPEGTPEEDPQEPGAVGTVDDSPYGSDAAYLNDGGDSNGSSMYVSTESSSAGFSYTFTGTGTSFFARTTKATGYMRVTITNTEGNVVYNSRRDTSYKVREENEDPTLYNIPVFTWNAENYGTYTVEVRIAGGPNAQSYGKNFWLDGIRIINPLDSGDVNVAVAESAYAADGESGMTMATLREKLLGDCIVDGETGEIVWDGDGFVIFTDTNGEIRSAKEYESNGPKEEVYLNVGQSIAFSLSNWDANINKLHLGIKAPMGSGSVGINGNEIAINNAADCYYDISKYGMIAGADGEKTITFTITAETGLISVTNIKVTGNPDFVIVQQKDVKASGDSDADVTVDEAAKDEKAEEIAAVEDGTENVVIEESAEEE